MRVLGVDPGMVVTGYGVVEEVGGELIMLDCGALVPPGNSSIGERLRHIYLKMTEVIACHQPSEMAIEEPFVARNVRSALAVGRAQAVAILAAAEKGIPVYRYTPAQVKQRVTDYGASDKERVQEMVRLQLGLSSAPHPSDAADALAVAICHIAEIRLRRLLDGTA